MAFTHVFGLLINNMRVVAVPANCKDSMTDDLFGSLANFIGFFYTLGTILGILTCQLHPTSCLHVSDFLGLPKGACHSEVGASPNPSPSPWRREKPVVTRGDPAPASIEGSTVARASWAYQM